MTTAPRVWAQRATIATVWLSAIVAWQVYQRSNDLGTTEVAQQFVDAVDGTWWGLLAFAGAYLLRPLLLVPASLMTVAAGLLFGPVVGVLLVIVAANASAMLAYGIGRTFARTNDVSELDADDERTGLIGRWGDRMRTRSFETVFLMRLLFLPYDVVNYASGALRIRWTAFLLATVLGTVPGTVSFVLLGASLERIDQGVDGVNPWTVVASVAIFLVSVLIARLARRRNDTEQRTIAPSGPAPAPIATHPVGAGALAPIPDAPAHEHRAS